MSATNSAAVTTRAIMPASFFGMVVGIAGLRFAWRQAHRVWDAPALVGEILRGIAAVMFGRGHDRLHHELICPKWHLAIRTLPD